MKVGDLIKCKGENKKNEDQFGVVVRLSVAPKPVPSTAFSPRPTIWVEIQWHDGHRTWEDMEASLEHNFEVVA
jgi:hypothetical protein